MGTLGLIMLGVAVWCALGLAVALLVGRMARMRDRHIPHDVLSNVAEFVPDPRDADADAPVHSPDGRGPGS